MTSLERVFVVSLAGALFVATLNLLTVAIADLSAISADIFMAMLAIVIASVIIFPIVAIVELIGRLLAVRRNALTFGLAIASAIGVVWLIDPVPVVNAFRFMRWISLVAAIGMACIWWNFLPLPDPSPTPNLESTPDA